MKLFESIQIKNGIPQRLKYHNQRMNRSRNDLFCLLEELYLEEFIAVPQEFSEGIVKCRVQYAEQIEKIEFENYQAQQHNLFYLINSKINYSHKYSDRDTFYLLKSSLPSSSEMIIIQDGFITDTSYSNLIFKDQNGNWFTPETYLLRGTQREFLLDEGIISERPITMHDLKSYTHLMMINAMLDFNEEREIAINNINP